jgi:hypothetical protein
MASFVLSQTLDFFGWTHDIAGLPLSDAEIRFSMIPGQNFNDRLKEQKEAKLAMLKRAKEKQLDPAEKAKIMEERAKRNEAREARETERRAERKRKEAEEAALKAEEERKKLLAIEAGKKAKEDLVKAQKARRDAKYAARKNKRR